MPCIMTISSQREVQSVSSSLSGGVEISFTALEDCGMNTIFV